MRVIALIFLSFIVIACKLPNTYNYKIDHLMDRDSLLITFNAAFAHNYNGKCEIVIKAVNKSQINLAMSLGASYIVVDEDTIPVGEIFFNKLEVHNNGDTTLLPNQIGVIRLGFYGRKNAFADSIQLKLTLNSYIDTMLLLKGHRQGYY